MSTETIRGRIIRILDTETVIVNLGSESGVSTGCVFHVLGEPETVVDPFSSDQLGSVTVVKAKVAASQVYARFSIARTKWRTQHLKGWGGGFGSLQSLFRTEEIDQGELRVDATQVEPWKAQSESPVRLGDPVEATVVQRQSLPRENTSLPRLFTFDGVDPESWRQALRFHSDEPARDKFVTHGVVDERLVRDDGTIARDTEGAMHWLEEFLACIAEAPRLRCGRAHIDLSTQSAAGDVSGALTVRFDFSEMPHVVSLHPSDRAPREVAVPILDEVAARLVGLDGVEPVPEDSSEMEA